MHPSFAIRSPAGPSPARRIGVDRGMCDGHHHGTLPTTLPAPPPSGPALTRRTTLAAGAGLLMAGSLGARTGAIADTGTQPRVGAARRSRLTRGTQPRARRPAQPHAALRRRRRPGVAFASMRSAGLDVAALTDHATLSDNLLGDVLDGHPAAGVHPARRPHAGRLARDPGVRRRRQPRRRVHRDPRLRVVRAAARPRERLVHRALHRRAPGRPDAAAATRGCAPRARPGARRRRRRARRLQPPRPRAGPLPGVPLRRRGCATGWCRWRCSTAATTTSSRGTPTASRPRSSPASTPAGGPGSPGVTDEHGTDWGLPEGKGRTGLWVTEHTPRRREGGDAGAAVLRDPHLGPARRRHRDPSPAAPHRMGSVLPDRARRRTDPARPRPRRRVGRQPLTVQVLRPGTDVPAVAACRGVPGRCGRRLPCPGRCRGRRLDAAAHRGPDPAQRRPRDRRATPATTSAVAYTSPWWIEPRQG